MRGWVVGLLACCAGISGCSGGGTSSSPPVVVPSPAPSGAPFIAKHLYVNPSVSGGTGLGSIFRFPLRDGTPGGRADFAYQSAFLGAFTTLPDGTIAAFGASDILVYAADSHTVLRRIDLPDSSDTFYSSLAVDSAGDLYVYYIATYYWDTACPGFFTGVLIYGPAAQGKSPYRCFGIPQNAGNTTPVGIALDSRGAVYVPTGSDTFQRGTVSVYGTPLRNATLIRVVSSYALHGTTSVALDRQDQLWTMNAYVPPHGQKNSYIAGFAAYADGDVSPTHIITQPTKQVWYGNVAVDDAYVYIGGDAQVLVYEKTTNGHTAPHATLTVQRTISGVGPWVGVAR